MKKLSILLINSILIHFNLIFSMYYDPINYKKIIREENNLNKADCFGNTILINACKDNEIEIVEILIQKKIEKNLVDLDLKDVFGFTALMRAVESGNAKIAQLLIDANANPNIEATNGNTAITRAAYKDYKEIVEILIKAGATLNLLRKNSKPDFLINPKENAQEISNLILFAKLVNAIKNNKRRTLKILLTKYPDLVDKDFNNALHITSQVEDQETAARLFQFILKFIPTLYNKKNKAGKTATDINPQIIYYLIKQNLINPEMIVANYNYCNVI